ncbi:MAG: hypothetical protein CMJ83_08235 [Planctomycetes bacterium]|nr:hypothetical protein [Planctomycetota bacterium]
MEPNAIQPTQASGLTAQFGNQDVNKQAFLNLLVTQLQNQDPFEPVGNEEFLAQLATFSQLEESQSTNALLGNLITINQADLALGGLAQGASLVGKVVEYLDPETGQQIRGTVYSVFFDPGGVLVEVDGNIVPAGSIVTISTEAPSSLSTSNGGTGSGSPSGTSGTSGTTGGSPGTPTSPTGSTTPVDEGPTT